MLKKSLNLGRKYSLRLYSKQQQIQSVNIFDREAKRIQRGRTHYDDEGEQARKVIAEVGWRLADRVFDIKKTFKHAADIGCSRGYVARHLSRDNIEKLTMCDSNETILREAQVPEDIEVKKIVMDEEILTFPENSLDLVISSLCLHWVNDLPGCFDSVMKCLRNDGVFLASMFGEDTLYELRSSLQLADLERNGGIAPHVSPFTKIRDVGGLLNRSGFTLQTIDTEEIVVGYPSMWELMRDLKLMGENNAVRHRPLSLNRETQIAAAAIYDQMYGKVEEEKKRRYIPATYQIIYLLGWKPDKSQPKPLSRGTGEISLKDLHKFEEIAQKKGKIQLDSEKEQK